MSTGQPSYSDICKVNQFLLKIIISTSAFINLYPLTTVNKHKSNRNTPIATLYDTPPTDFMHNDFM